MKKLFFMILCAVLMIALAGCGCSNSQTEPTQTVTEADTAGNISTFLVHQNTSDNVLILEEGDADIISIGGVPENYLENTQWISSDVSVASVDDAGRVDALKAGTAEITAEYDGSKIICSIKVIQNEEDELQYSTAITANKNILSSNLKDNSGRMPYALRVNRSLNCTTAYTYDENGEYTVPVRAMIASCGADGGTITGDFSIYYQTEWNPLFGDVYGKYVSGFSGDYLFHSVPFYEPQSDMLEVDEYNKLGENASMGCVRMAVADTKWVLENCEVGTAVTVYDDHDSPGPLGRPESMHITDTQNGWDPTDDDPDNPYKDKKPAISGARDLEIKKGAAVDLLSGITAVDTCNNDITDRIRTKGTVVANKAGAYKVSYVATDAMYRTDRVDITVKVV